MKTLYDQNTGKIYYSIYNTEYFKFIHTTNIPLSIFEIDEIDPSNKSICTDLSKYGNGWRRDINGLGKYYMQNDSGTWNLYELDGWTEFFPEMMI